MVLSEDRARVSDWIRTSQFTHTIMTSVSIQVSPPALDFSCQVDISGPPLFSVSTSMTDPMLVPTSVDVGTSMDKARVGHVVVLWDSSCNTKPKSSLPVEEEDTEDDEVVALPPSLGGRECTPCEGFS